MPKHFLLAPGPTPVPPQVLAAMAQPIIHHRTAEFEALFAECADLLKQVFRTEHPVLTFAASGTGALEAAICNTLSAGDTAIVPRYGKFSERWANICNAYGVNVVALDVEWGTSPTPELIADALKANPDAKVVCTTLCETSTCVRGDVEGIGEVCKQHDVLMLCDGVSGLGAEDIHPDAAGVDVMVTGSQKALMLPPGLAFASFSPRAQEAAKTSTLPKFYFNVPKALESLGENTTPWTPAVSLMYGLQVALRMMVDEGIDNVIARHGTLAAATRAGVSALELPLYSQCPSHVATAVAIPDEIGAGAVKKALYADHGITVAGGQAQLKGKIIRIAHLGYNEPSDVYVALTALGSVVKKLGHNCTVGDGITAAEAVLAA